MFLKIQGVNSQLHIVKNIKDLLKNKVLKDDKACGVSFEDLEIR